MKKALLVVLVLTLKCLWLIAQPQSNPISDFYSDDEGYPAWTDEIKWDNVVTMSDKGSGVANFEEFKIQRDLLYAQGGGVLYYPAGVYVFDISDSANSEGLMLKKGVVIRGERPSLSTRAVLPTSDIATMSTADHGLESMPTQFQFTTTNLSGRLNGQISKMWNCIGIKRGSNETSLDQVEKVGICWVEIEYGYIYFGFDATKWATSYSTAAYKWCNPTEPWNSQRKPNGMHPMDWFAGNFDWNLSTRIKMGTKRFVFGVHVKQGGVPNYVLAHGLGTTFYTEAQPWWFGSKIGVYGSNVFIANNVISKPTKCFVMKIMAGNKKANEGGSLPVGMEVEVPYDFGSGLSFDVNKNYMGGFINNSAVDDPSSQYTSNVVVQDNWAYNHSSKGYDISGGWMVVKNNINRREKHAFVDVYNLGLIKFYGVMSSNGRIWKSKWNDDFLARAFTVSSKNAWYHKNQWNNTGTEFDNSAEGILHQDHLNGSECYSAALTYNKGNSYVGVWNSIAIGFFLGYNNVSSDIMLIGPSYASDISSVKHQNYNGTIEYKFPSSLSSISSVKDFQSFNCTSGGLMPGIPNAIAKDTADYVKITWTNVANEAAYRIEKKKETSSNWKVIAYRPRQETGGVVYFGGGISPSIRISAGHGSDAWDGKKRDMNPAEWRDYLKSSGNYQYRVVAIGCEDLNSSAISNIEEVKVVLLSNNENFTKLDPTLVIYPNPSHERVTISIQNRKINEVKIYSILGKLQKKLSNINDNTCSVSLSDLPIGHYIILVQTEEGQFKKLLLKE